MRAKMQTHGIDASEAPVGLPDDITYRTTGGEIKRALDPIQVASLEDRYFLGEGTLFA